MMGLFDWLLLPFRFVVWLVRDTWSDLVWLAGLFDGGSRVNMDVLDQDWAGVFRDYGLFFVICVAFLLCGVFLSGKYWQVRCVGEMQKVIDYYVPVGDGFVLNDSVVPFVSVVDGDEYGDGGGG